MRLSERERDVIRRATTEVAGATTRVLLFGARTQHALRGGDIDLLIELAQPFPDRWALANKLGARIERQLALQKDRHPGGRPSHPRFASTCSSAA